MTKKLTMDIHGTLKETADKFRKEQAEAPGIIHWISTYDIAMIPRDKLFPLFDLALPHKVMANEANYGYYEPLWKWVDQNCKGLVTHVNIQFWFQDKEEALRFKLTWG